jgi:alkylated DNA repair dioxygenase AlkB
MWKEIDMPDARVMLQTPFLAAGEADVLLQRLLTGLDWQCDSVRLFGRSHPIPRLHQWYGDVGARYRWSGLTLDPHPWPPALEALRDRLQGCLGAQFNSVLANLYRDGADTMGWHADDEPELGSEPVIASLSLGAERDMLFRRRDGSGGRSRRIALPHGSLLVMAGPTQRNWQHALPRRRRVTTPRVNLTFRLVRSPVEAQAATSKPAVSMASRSAAG